MIKLIKYRFCYKKLNLYDNFISFGDLEKVIELT
jgi:hypothetical protein